MWINLRDAQTNITNTSFHKALRKRGYEGNIEIDHTSRTLALKVAVSASNAAASNASTKVSQPVIHSYFQHFSNVDCWNE
jgi:hypothetical protein